MIFRIIVALPVPLTAALMLSVWSVSGQIQPIDQDAARQIAEQLREVDFEALATDASAGFPGRPSIPNPLRLEGITLTDPFVLQSGFCSSPTCLPDSDNPDGGNIVLSLNRGGTLSFTRSPSVVILDIQGIGDNPFSVGVTDRNGNQQSLSGQGVLFGQTLLAVSSPGGIDKIEVQDVGGTGGPLVLTRVLMSEVPEPSSIVLVALGTLMLAGRLKGGFKRSRLWGYGERNREALL